MREGQAAEPRDAGAAPGRDTGALPEAAGPDEGALRRHAGSVVTGAAYGVLFLLGVMLGVVGGFQHSWYLGDVPIAALVWLVLLFGVPYGMGRLMGGRAAALVPALGWLLASMPLMGRQTAGDLVIAADAAGYWYLYGGCVAVALAVVATPSSGSWLLRSYGRS